MRGVGEDQESIKPDFGEPGDCFPYSVCGLIVVLWIMAQLNTGAATWPFNAIDYIPGWAGLTVLGACLAGVVVVTRKLKLFESLSPDRVQALCILAGIAVVCAVVMTKYRPVFPTLEGDGHINDADVLGGRRLRLIVVALVEKAFSISRAEAAARVWHFTGYAYLAGVVAFVMSLEKTFWARLMGVLFFVSLPSVLNFAGYTDSYGDFYVLSCAMLGCLYLGEKHRSYWWTGAAAVCFALLAKTHYNFYMVLLYPAWYAVARILKRMRTGDRWYQAVVACGVAGFVCLAALKANGWKLAGACELTRLIWRQDGPMVALVQPLLLILATIPAYLLFVAAAAGTGGIRLLRVREPVQAAALYGSASILCAYYAVQLVAPKACFGILDFVCQGGCLGGLFAVPLFVLLRETGWKRHVYCFVAVGLFFTVPAVMLHGGPPNPLLARLGNAMEGERSSYYKSLSPFVHVGMKFKDIALTYPTNSLAREQVKGVVYQAFTQGVETKGYYSPLASLNLCYLISWQYCFGDIQQGQANLLRLLQTWPDKSTNLLYDQPCLTEMDTRPLLSDFSAIAGQLCAATSAPIYSNLLVASLKLLEVRTKDVAVRKALVGRWVLTNDAASGTSIETSEYFEDGRMSSTIRAHGADGTRIENCMGRWSFSNGFLHMNVLFSESPNLVSGQHARVQVMAVDKDTLQYVHPADGTIKTEYRVR